MPKKLWGGRFKKPMDPLLKEFSYSLHVDKELFEAELEVNLAWAEMLGRTRLISATESRKLAAGIQSVGKALRKEGLDKYVDVYEDIHSLMQQILEKKIGVLGKKLHTGRSRNDLVVTSTKLYLKKKAEKTIDQISLCQRAFVKLAKKANDLSIAGLTHLKMAQPILMAHHLLAYVEMFEEDKERIADASKRFDALSLGSAALAGSSLAIDQRFLAKKLGFGKITSNSMAAVSDRAFVTEFVSCLAMLWMHLSRFSEDMILWNSEAFHYVELDDAFATGSSLMPQKKNPDIFELARGRSSVIIGHLMSLLTLQKGLPLAYNRDLQEDKPALFDAIGKTELTLELIAKALGTVSFNQESMEMSVVEETLYATDLLEYLVRKSMPFSQAHETVGKVIRYASEKGKELTDVSLEEWKRFSGLFQNDIYDLFDPITSVSQKKTVGSTNPLFVKKEIQKWQRKLKKK